MANREFHFIPIRASREEQVTAVLERIWDLLVTFFTEWEANWEYLQESGREQDLRFHTALLHALEAGNGSQARRVAEEHIQDYLDILYSLREKPVENAGEEIQEKKTYQEGKIHDQSL